MKILKFVLPLAVIALLSSFVVSKISEKKKCANATTKIQYKKPVVKKHPVDPVYKKFIEKFDKVSLPYSIKIDKPRHLRDEEGNMKYYGTKDESNYLGKSFAVILPEIKDGMMSRMGPDDFMAEALLKTGDKFDIVVYSRSGSFKGYKTFYAASFNKQGKLISRIEVAQIGYESMKDLNVSKDLQLTVEQTAIESEYSEQTQKHKMSYKKTGKDIFEVSDEGKFVKLKNTDSKSMVLR